MALLFETLVVPKDLCLTIYETGLSPICVVLVFLFKSFAFLKPWCDIFYKINKHSNERRRELCMMKNLHSNPHGNKYCVVIIVLDDP